MQLLYWHPGEYRTIIDNNIIASSSGGASLNITFFLRWCVKESLTIREASWLTDRTYDYNDVVRMIGELVAVHKGNIRVRRQRKFSPSHS